MAQKPPATTSHASNPPSGNAVGSDPPDTGATFSESCFESVSVAIDSCGGAWRMNGSKESLEGGSSFIYSRREFPVGESEWFSVYVRHGVILYLPLSTQELTGDTTRKMIPKAV
jgi:hypothetical protein